MSGSETYKAQKVAVGWGLDERAGSVVFPAPAAVFSERSKALSNRAVQACPAVNDFERDLFQIYCPFNIRLRIQKNNENCDLHIVEDGTRVDEDLISKFVVLMHPKTWRQPDIPVIQIKVPYFFLSDQPCMLTQMPPFMDEAMMRWPGTLIAGRFPTDVWPRVLNWAFEWQATDEDLILKRGSPLCYLQFDTKNLNSRIDLFQLEQTPELIEYRDSIAMAPKYMSNTFSLFETAAERRPKKLLVRKKQ